MMRRNTPGLIPEGGVIGRLPFDGQWLTERSPTRRVPSHGTHLFATTYALDFVAVDDDGLTAPTRSRVLPGRFGDSHAPSTDRSSLDCDVMPEAQIWRGALVMICGNVGGRAELPRSWGCLTTALPA